MSVLARVCVRVCQALTRLVEFATKVFNPGARTNLFGIVAPEMGAARRTHNTPESLSAWLHEHMARVALPSYTTSPT